MKKIQLMSLLTALFLVLGANLSHAQLPVNTITRTPCISGYIGCSDDALSLTLSGTIGGIPGSATHTLTMSSSATYITNLTKISVSVGSHTSSAAYYLPTAIGDQTFISPTDGTMDPYGVVITKTGSHDFTIAVNNLTH